MGEDPVAGESDVLAYTVLDDFIDWAKSQAARTDRPLSSETLDDLVSSYKETASEAALLRFTDGFETALRKLEKIIINETRQHPFDRILVQRFSSLFFGRGIDGPYGRVLSRRVLPGFFIAFEELAGRDLFQRSQIACREIVQSKIDEALLGFTWRLVYEDDGSNRLVDDMLAAVAVQFADFDQRLEWLYETISSHLPPDDDPAYAHEGEEGWSFDEKDIREILKGLFKPIKGSLQTDAGKIEIKERYEDEGRKALVSLMDHLYPSS